MYLAATDATGSEAPRDRKPARGPERRRQLDAVGRAIAGLEPPAEVRERDDEPFLATYRRVGSQPFKEAVYGSHPA